MDISKVKELNSRIEQIGIQKTKAETKREMLLNTLKKQLEEYKNEYGLDLLKTNSNGEMSLKGTMESIVKERDSVESDLMKEYELKLKVVQSIDSGDIDTANYLLGIVPESTERANEENDEEAPSSVAFNEEFETPIVEDDDAFEEMPKNEEVEVIEEYEDDFGLGSIEDEEDEGERYRDSEEEYEEAVVGKKVENIGSSTEDTVKALDKSNNIDNMYMELDDSSDEFGFDFGSLMEGSKFSV